MRELTGLPCVHVVAGYTHLKKDSELRLTDWYSKNKWFESYQYSIRPVPGTKLWKKSDLPKPLPSGERKLPERQNGSNAAMERDQYQQADASVDEIPNQVNEASGSKSNLTPEEHAEMMDKEAFVDMVKRDAENKAKVEEMWREAYEEDKYWEEYESEFKDWEFREEEENKIGIVLSVDDEHIIGNKEPVNPSEQTHVVASASSAPIDEKPETSQDPSTEKVGSSAPVDQFPETPQDPKKKANKRKKKADSKQPLPFRIYHKNRRRSERIAKLQAKKFKFDANGTGSTPEKAFDVSD
ncbi:hypothetical protein Tco_0375049 [Tanacetum coccineum]